MINKQDIIEKKEMKNHNSNLKEQILMKFQSSEI